jgi:hypothetical protein
MRSRIRNSSSVATFQIAKANIAVEALGNLVAPLLVSAQHDFRVTEGLEVMAKMLERLAQLHEVVNLAGINERGNAVLVLAGRKRPVAPLRDPVAVHAIYRGRSGLSRSCWKTSFSDRSSPTWPLCSLLSGGLDSSSVTALAHRAIFIRQGGRIREGHKSGSVSATR